MRKRSRAHEAGSVEAGSSISKSTFFANRVVRAVVRAFVCTQSSQPRAPQERPKSGQERPKSDQEEFQSGQEQTKSGQERLLLSGSWSNKGSHKSAASAVRPLQYWFLAFPQGPGGFRKLRGPDRNHFHLSWYLPDYMVTSYDQKPWRKTFSSVYGTTCPPNRVPNISKRNPK